MAHPPSSANQHTMGPKCWISQIIKDSEAEIANTDEIMLFTWNPNPKRMKTLYLDDTEDVDYASMWIDMIKVLRALHRCSNLYVIIPEVSDNGKLHCHGWFRMSDKTKWLKSVCGTIARKGFIKVERMKSLKALKEYYKKSLKVTATLLPKNITVFSSMNTYEVFNYIRRKEQIILDDVKVPTSLMDYIMDI